MANNIELKEFIKETIIQIVEGVSEPKNAVEELGYIVGPIVIPDKPSVASPRRSNGVGRVEDIEFDIAVEAKAGTETKGKLSILAGALGVGAEGGSKNETNTTNRIKFSVPICFSRLAPVKEKTELIQYHNET